ncbi:MAG: flagellar biosynthetic protein FliR [Oligoflexia bacterium]|nr:flagellar biosynthetic protein FliR [Oligoflexia bacterium]
MIEILITDQVRLIAFWLCFIRWSTAIIQLPLFDSTDVPEILKILSSFIITYAFFPNLESTIINDINYVGQDNFWCLSIIYAIFGLAVGYMLKLIMNTFLMAGSLISQNIGLSTARYFDPTTLSTIGPIEKLIQETMILLIILSGAIFPMFKGIFLSIININVVSFANMSLDPNVILEFFKSLFFSGLMLSSPLVVIQVLINIIMGITSRAIPQMNILLVSFIVNIGLGFVIFALISDEFFTISLDVYKDMLGIWFKVVS